MLSEASFKYCLKFFPFLIPSQPDRDKVEKMYLNFISTLPYGASKGLKSLHKHFEAPQRSAKMRI